MQADAEVFDLPKNAGFETLPQAERFNLDIANIAEMWRRGSVITSWLLDLAASAGYVRSTRQAAIDAAVVVDVLPAALARFRSRRIAQESFSAMRTGFGRLKALQP
jgi:6-phosphogluconate dehydrogenase